MSTTTRQLLGEFLGTALLLFVIVGRGIVADRLSNDGGVELLTVQLQSAQAWVLAIVLASPSAGFANPAVTVARGLTDAYPGIAGESILWFVVVQLIAGVAAAYALFSITTKHDRNADGITEGEV